MSDETTIEPGNSEEIEHLESISVEPKLNVAEIVIDDEARDDFASKDESENLDLPAESFNQTDALVDIKVQHSPAISFAQTINNINFLSGLAVSPRSNSTLQNIEIRISIFSIGRKLNKTWERFVPVLTSESGRLAGHDLRIEIEPKELIGIDQLQPAEIEVKVLHEGIVIGQSLSKLRVLPADAWTLTPPLAANAATLAAFVNPFDPAVDELLHEATPRLRALGADGWSGEQVRNPRYWDVMAKAIYETLCARDIKYINPPPSWELDERNGLDFGQRIRSASGVINGRLGTCLDTSVTFAAILEKIGLRPVLVLMPGHAQVGYWRVPLTQTGRFSNPLTDLRELFTHVDAGNIALIESTEYAKADPAAFENLTSIARQRIHMLDVFTEHSMAQDAVENWAVAIDIATARGISGIGVLPTKHILEDGTVEVIAPTLQALSLQDVRDGISSDSGGAKGTLSDNNFPPRVRNWRSSLLDLSLNNPLIRMRKNTLRLAVPPGALGTIEDLLQSGRELGIEQVNLEIPGLKGFIDRGVFDDPQISIQLMNELGQANTLLAAVPASVSFQNVMRRLVTAHKNSIDETGSNDLYLALGTLDWTAQSSSSYEKVQAPLFLVPITIKSYNRSRNFKISIDSSNPLVPNYSLLEKLDKEFDFKLPKLENPDLDDYGVDIDGTIQYIRERITEQNLDFLVDESAHIGTFDFSTYRLWRDLTDNWKKFEERNLVKHLIHSPNDEYQGNSDVVDLDDIDLDELSTELPIPVDGTQAQAIADALSGKSLIIEGPPGTGKSQTITNLLVKALRDGKRVLFVAEKSVAVDVVIQRLSAIGMENFFLDLHNKGSRPSAVRDQIQAALARAAHPDSVGLEVAQRAHSQSAVPLKSFPEQLHTRGKFQESAYSANDVLMSIKDGPQVTITPEFLSTVSREQLDSFMANLDHVADAGSKSGNSKINRWSLATLTNEQFTDGKRDSLTALTKELVSTVDLTNQSTVNQLLSSVNVQQFLKLAVTLNETAPAVSAVEANNSALAKENYSKLQTVLDQLDASATTNQHVSPRVVDMPFDALQAELIAAKSSFIMGRSKKVAATLDRINTYLNQPVQDVATLELQILPHLKQVAEFALHVRKVALDQPGLTLAISWNPLDENDRISLASQKAKLDRWADLLLGDDAASIALRNFTREANEETTSTVRKLGQLLQGIFETLQVSETSLELWSDGKNLGDHLSEDAKYLLEDARDIGFASLNRWTLLYTLVEPLVSNGASVAAREILSEKVPFFESANAFRRSFYEMVRLRQIREQGLETFDGANHDRNIGEFNRSMNEIRKFLPEQYAYDLIQMRGFDATVSTGAVGELARELNKSRGQKPVRALLKQHWKVLTRITPCVLASPSSVALFLDPELEPFDLVIFDEASQIKVPHAIGAIGRAKAAVIVGDSRQMPPSTAPGLQAKEVEYTDEEDLQVSPDEESILSEGVMARLPRAWLSWHYRSEDESLIAFSNQQYYEGRLSSFPSPSKERSTKGVTFISANGHFYRPGDKDTIDPLTGKQGDKGTNPIEARAIVAEITRRLNDPVECKYSILVVTLNEQQAALISNLLADSDDEKVQEALAADVEEPLMVKALEQVQGSERDIVLMSVAFSRNERGILPANFGPLNRQNGHRRLNVAVTRARRQVLVYCSFDPSELEGKSQARGITDLQAFLQIAKSGDDSMVTLTNPGDAIDRHRDAIAKALTDRGFNVELLVGASDFKVDIAIKHPDRPEERVLGILLDNAPWHRRKTVIDRDTLPSAVLLNKMGWPAIERIWLPMWLKDSNGEISRIESIARSAIAGTHSKPAETKPTPTVALTSEAPKVQVKSFIPSQFVPETKPVEQFAGRRWAPWNVKQLGEKWQLDGLPDQSAQTAVRNAMVGILAAEAPIEPMRAARLVGQAYGLSSMFEKRANDILRVSLPGTTRDNEGFIYLESQHPDGDWSEWRSSEPSDARKITEISLHEIANAMRYLAVKSLGIAEEELFKETASAFGIQRLTDTVKLRLTNALRAGISRGTLKQEGNHIVAT